MDRRAGEFSAGGRIGCHPRGAATLHGRARADYGVIPSLISTLLNAGNADVPVRIGSRFALIADEDVALPAKGRPYLLIAATNLTERAYLPSVKSPLSSSLPFTISFSIL